MNTNNQQIEIISEVVEHLETDLGKLKDLDALTPALVDVKLFKNVLFDILPEAEPQYESSRNQLIECILLLRNLFIDCRKLPVKEQKKRIKRASQLLKKKINLDEELSYFMLKLYCLEMSSLERSEVETIVKPPIPPEIKARIRRRRAWISKVIVICIIILVWKYPLILQKAKNFLAICQYKIGISYLDGNWLLKKDEAEGLDWLKKSAYGNNSEAQYLLGETYLLGKYSKNEDTIEGIKWITKSAEQNNENAQYLLGEAYLFGKYHIKQSPEDSIIYLLKSAQAKNEKALLLLGEVYLRGKYGFPRNTRAGLTCLLACAQKNNSKAQFYLAEVYLSGDYGEERDEIEGLKWLKKSANNGYERALYKLADCYENGTVGLHKNLAKANELYRAAYRSAIKNNDRELIKKLKEHL